VTRCRRLGWVVLITVGIVLAILVGFVERRQFLTFGLCSLTIYGCVALSHFLLQLYFALRARAGQSPWQRRLRPLPARQTVRVVISTYREDPVLLRNCLLSVAAQGKAVDRVILCNDEIGDRQTEAVFQDVVRSVPLGTQRWEYRSNGTSGKRGAMYNGVWDAQGGERHFMAEEIVVFLDSDSVLTAAHSVSRLIEPFANSQVGCAVGEVLIHNRTRNALTWITNLGYWTAFNLERQAQSYCGAVSCVFGPFGAYRAAVVRRVIDRWRGQTFMGRPCDPGGDRHLTTCVLAEGYLSVCAAQAAAQTEAPWRFSRFLIQQTRWSRSSLREFLISIPHLGRSSVWRAYELCYQVILPLLVLTNLGIIIDLAVTRDWRHLALWVAIIGFFGFLRSLYGAAATRRASFVAFTLYGYLYTAFLLPLRLYALATVYRTDWAPRPARSLD